MFCTKHNVASFSQGTCLVCDLEEETRKLKVLIEKLQEQVRRSEAVTHTTGQPVSEVSHDSI